MLSLITIGLVAINQKIRAQEGSSVQKLDLPYFEITQGHQSDTVRSATYDFLLVTEGFPRIVSETKGNICQKTQFFLHPICF